MSPEIQGDAATDLTEGRKEHERLLKETLSKARRGSPDTESVRVLARHVTEGIRAFLERRDRPPDAFPENTWRGVLVNVARRCHSTADVSRQAHDIAHDKFPAFCAALEQSHGFHSPMLERFVYRHLLERKERKAHQTKPGPRRWLTGQGRENG